MRRRVFMGLGAASIGAGVLHSTGAFSSLSAGRGVAVSAADDLNGLLGINDDVYPVEFTNNTGNFSMDVTLESTVMSFDVDEDGEFEEPATFTIEEGETQEVELQGDDGNVAIEVELSKDESNVGSIDLDRFFEVPAVAALAQVEGTVEEATGNGRYDFELENTGDDPVTLDGFGINWTDPNAVQVPRPQGGDDILSADGTQIIDETITVGGSIVSVIDGEEVTLNPSTPVNFEFERFSDTGDDDGGSGQGVQVVDVDLEVRGDDGRSVEIELRADDDAIEE